MQSVTKEVIPTIAPHWLSDEEIVTLGEERSTKQYLGDPTVRFGESWFFCNETRDALYGPYATRELAHAGAVKYAETML